jgi:hypothetical protein
VCRDEFDSDEDYEDAVEDTVSEVSEVEYPVTPEGMLRLVSCYGDPNGE